MFKTALGTRLASAKWNEFTGKPDKINELILKTKADLKKRPDNSHPWVIFSADCLAIDLERKGDFVRNWTSKVKMVKEFWT